MKTPDKNKCGLECIRTNVERICVKPEKGQCPRCEQIVGRNLELEAIYSQVSNALCGKENATLDEVLQVVRQVKAELEAVKRERDAAVRDIPRACEYCKHYEIIFNGATPDHDCKNPECYNISGVNTGWQWRGVCPENTEEEK